MIWLPYARSGPRYTCVQMHMWVYEGREPISSCIIRTNCFCHEVIRVILPQISGEGLANSFDTSRAPDHCPRLVPREMNIRLVGMLVNSQPTRVAFVIGQYRAHALLGISPKAKRKGRDPGYTVREDDKGKDYSKSCYTSTCEHDCDR